MIAIVHQAPAVAKSIFVVVVAANQPMTRSNPFIFHLLHVIVVPHNLVLLVPPHQRAPFQLVRRRCLLPLDLSPMLVDCRATRNLPLPRREVPVAVQRHRLDPQIMEVLEGMLE